MAQISRATTWASGQTLTASALNGEFTNIVNAWNNTDTGSTLWQAVSTSGAVTSTLTTNQLVLGTTRTVTITAPTPASLSRTWTIPDISGNGTVAALEATQTFTGTNTFSGQLIGKGTATNNDAAAGYIGEYVSSVVSSSIAAGTSNQYKDYTTVSLTAGDWDITGVLEADMNGATVTLYTVALSVNSGNTSSDHVDCSNNIVNVFSAGTTDLRTQIVPSYRLSLSTTTIVYLKGRLAYSVATPNMIKGRISARRIR